MDGIKSVQAKDPAALRKAVKEGEEFVLFDEDGEPLFRCTPIAQALQKSAKHFQYYPHDPAQCLYTCWRHPRDTADSQQPQVAAAP